MTRIAELQEKYPSYFPIFYHSKRSTPKNINDPKLDELIDAALAAKDQQERLRLQLEAAARAKEGYSSLAVVEVQWLLGVGAKVGEVGFVEFSVEGASALVYETIDHAK